MRNDENLKPTAGDTLGAVRHIAQLRGTFSPPLPPAPPARLDFAVTDLTSLPAEYLLPNVAALRALADSWREGDPVPCLSGAQFNIFTPSNKPCPSNPRKKRPVRKS